jgi:hypothetical protein
VTTSRIFPTAVVPFLLPHLSSESAANSALGGQVSSILSTRAMAPGGMGADASSASRMLVSRASSSGESSAGSASVDRARILAVRRGKRGGG